MAFRRTLTALTAAQTRVGHAFRMSRADRGMTSHSYHSEEKYRKYGHMYTKPQHAGYVGLASRYMQRSTFSPHTLERPFHETLGFKQFVRLDEDYDSLIDTHFVPQQAKKEYEEWKVANVEEVKKHRGRYAVVRWSLGDKGIDGEGGIVESFTRAELAAVDVEKSPEQWVDYIAPQFGECDHFDAEEDARWNYSDFGDVDELKEWLNFSDRRSHYMAPNTTPVSAPGGPKEKELRPRPAMEKALTFVTSYGYGSEHYGPIYEKWSDDDMECDFDVRTQSSNSFMSTFGISREVVLDQPSNKWAKYRNKKRIFVAVRSIPKRFQVTEVHPLMRSIRVTDCVKAERWHHMGRSWQHKRRERRLIHHGRLGLASSQFNLDGKLLRSRQRHMHGHARTRSYQNVGSRPKRE